MIIESMNPARVTTEDIDNAIDITPLYICGQNNTDDNAQENQASCSDGTSNLQGDVLSALFNGGSPAIRYTSVPSILGNFFLGTGPFFLLSALLGLGGKGSGYIIFSSLHFTFHNYGRQN